MPKCQECGDELDEDCEFETGQKKLCFECFEAALEIHEMLRREKTARKNEY